MVQDALLHNAPHHRAYEGDLILRSPCSGRKGGRITLKLHARCLLKLGTSLAEIEESTLRETEHASEQRRRKLLDARVVFLNRVVEEAAGRRKLVFEVRQLGLQLLEVLICLEIWIGFRKCKQ